jgi:predicted glycoside hydrolase/deacetylase ChbG (UPF0249 family)
MIINADDFGYSASVNRAILQAFDDGLVSSATLMANMPGFEEASALAHERKLIMHVGAHLVLSEGQPLTERMRQCRRFCDAAGRFVPSRRAFWLSNQQIEIVGIELRAQIERCRRGGLVVTHLDSHHHVHNQPAIGRVVIQLARELGVAHVRLARNCGRGIGPIRRAYKAYLNHQIVRTGLARTRYFGVVDDYLHLRRHGTSGAELADFEVMTHPVFGDDGNLVEGLAPGTPLRDLVTRLEGYESAVSFAGVKYA